MLILNSKDVVQSLPMRDAIDGMRAAFVSLASGIVEMPERMHVDVDRHEGEMLVMPAFVAGDSDALAVKVVGVFPRNLERNLPSVMGAVCVFDPTSCQPIAMLDGASLTGIRTAAVSAVATEVMANPDARSLALLGTGVQARTHWEAVCHVRNIEKVLIFGRSKSKAESLKQDLLDRTDFAHEIEICESADEAVSKADIVCTVTSAATPLFSPAAVQPGTHFNVVGSHSVDRREVPSAAVGAAIVAVDQTNVAVKSGDLAIPIEDGILDPKSIRELGELLVGNAVGRTASADVTLFKSVGLAMEDAVAASLCVKNAAEKGIGQSADW